MVDVLKNHLDRLVEKSTEKPYDALFIILLCVLRASVVSN